MRQKERGRGIDKMDALCPSPGDDVDQHYIGWQMCHCRVSIEENFFTVLFDAAPSLQIMFKSPKAVTAMRCWAQD